MATKWKRFRHSRALKIVLFLTIVGCLTTIVGMGAYTLGYEYDIYYLPECITVKDYIDTNQHYQEVNNAFRFAQDDMQSMLESNPDKQFENGEVILRDIKANFVYFITYKNSKTNTNVSVTNTSAMVKNDFFSSADENSNNESYAMGKYGFFYCADETGYTETHGSISPSSFITDNYITEVKIAFDTDYIQSMKYNWDTANQNTWRMIVAGALCLVTAMTAFILLLLIVGKNGESVVCPPHRIYCIFTELQLAGLLVGGYYYFTFLYELIRRDHVPYFGVELVIALCCVVSVMMFAYFMYVACGVVINLQNKRFLKNFLVVRILMLLWKWLTKAGAGAKKLFLCEPYCKKGIMKFHYSRQGILVGGLLATAIVFLVLNSVFPYANGFAVLISTLLLIGLITAYYVTNWRLVLDAAKLNEQIDKLAEGHYDVVTTINEKSPYYEPSQKLCAISGGYIVSLDERIKAERMKIELVTNVSHDLKTPLTSIISYVELLSKEELSPEAADYVKILQQKSERLKNIVSDVFELAKTTSGEITLDMEQIDLNKLIVQTLADIDDKIQQSGLVVRTKLTAENTHIMSDGKRMYRVFQNVMDNALKYSLKGTRIYVELTANHSVATLEVKNTSSYEMTFTKEEILERFTRGDKSRTTEGSGLGLSIAQGFTIACGGKFDIEIDGDMFKVIIEFPITRAVSQPAPPKDALVIPPM